jgi:hypothetical protein
LFEFRAERNELRSTRVRRLTSARRPLAAVLDTAETRYLRRRPDWSAGQGSGEPEHNKNNKHQSENAAQSSPAVSPVGVIAATASQQNHDKNDQQNRHHDRFSFFFELTIMPRLPRVP